MNSPDLQIHVAPVAVRDPHVQELLSALTAELARGGYAENQTFGYSADQLERAGVHLVGAKVGNVLVGVAGVELTDGAGELKRFFVRPEHRGSGVADALIDALLQHADANGIGVLRLETGDKQHAAISSTAGTGSSRYPASVRTSTAPRRCACSAPASATSRKADKVNEQSPTL